MGITTMIYPHVLNKGGMGVRSPADMLRGIWKKSALLKTRRTPGRGGKNGYIVILTRWVYPSHWDG